MVIITMYDKHGQLVHKQKELGNHFDESLRKTSTRYKKSLTIPFSYKDIRKAMFGIGNEQTAWARWIW